MHTRKGTSNEREARLLTELADLVHGVTMPFACGGSFVSTKPVTLQFKDGVTIPVRRMERPEARDGALDDLLQRCAPAPFGRGKKTRYDRAVRDALALAEPSEEREDEGSSAVPKKRAASSMRTAGPRVERRGW
jgi:hypothetical protein